MSAASGSRHLRWIEAARTMAMLVVVWSHASNMAFFREGDFSVTPLFSACLVTFAVPAFFLLSLKVLYGVPLGHWQRLIELAVGSMQLCFIFALLQLLSLACLTGGELF
ncbi:hypothetical protein [Solidesulfovibrio sp. C21]|uniref:hypothetical protein n=1 Tax=Solidesulfovibrio sp. C21 TaxID=3398613 RepID=UPI0039FC2A23